MNTSKPKFRIKFQYLYEKQWSIGMCFSHMFDETYLYINLFKISISIGLLDDT